MLWLWKEYYDYESDEQLDEPDTTNMLNLENKELAAQKNNQTPTQSTRHTKRDINKRH